MKTKKFRAFYMYDERTSNTLFGVEFEKNLGGLDVLVVDSDIAENPEKLRQALKKKGAVLTGSKTQQIISVKKLLTDIEPDVHQLAMKPGFRGAGFILGETMLGTARDTYVWRATAGRPDIGREGRHYGRLAQECRTYRGPIEFRLACCFYRPRRAPGDLCQAAPGEHHGLVASFVGNGDLEFFWRQQNRQKQPQPGRGRNLRLPCRNFQMGFLAAWNRGSRRGSK